MNGVPRVPIFFIPEKHGLTIDDAVISQLKKYEINEYPPFSRIFLNMRKSQLVSGEVTDLTFVLAESYDASQCQNMTVNLQETICAFLFHKGIISGV